MLNNKKCILVYNLNDEELQKLKRLPFKVIEITKEMTSMTVKNIIEGLEIETVSENSPEEKKFSKEEKNKEKYDFYNKKDSYWRNISNGNSNINKLDCKLSS